ncbi:MAG: hypothetical protein VYA32_04810 [Planctomycetota bacterium]|nr:hypothetical protein [Planctomycetota bacterium]
MATTPRPSLPPQLQQALGQLGRRWRWLTVLHGVGLFLLATTAILAAGVLLDLLLPLSPTVRIVTLALVLGGIAWAGFRLLLVRLATNISPAELAALVERDHPELEERLTSSVELLDSDDCGGGDEGLRDLLLAETTAAVQSVNFHQILTFRTAIVVLAWAGTAVGLMFGPLAVPGSGHALLMTRLFLPWSNLQRTVLFQVDVDQADRVVARGSDVRIRVHVSSPSVAASTNRPVVVPRNVWCRWTTSTGTTDRRLMERTVDGTAYTTTWPEVLEGFQFHVDADGSLSRTHSVRVVEPPAVTGLALNIVPPGYTGQSPRTTDAVVGDVRVLAGSRLTWRLQFNKPIREASLKLLSAPRPTSLAGNLAADGLSATVELEVETGGALLVELTDRDGLHRDDQTYRRLVILDDQPPTLALSGNDRPTAVRPTDAITVRTEAADDFGLGTLELVLQVDPDTQDRQQVAPDRLAGRRAVEHFTIDLSKFELQTGARLTYRVRVTDNRDRPAPNETFSAPRVLLIDPNAQPPDLADIVARQKDTRVRIELARSQSLAARATLETTRAQVLSALKNQSTFAGNNVIRKTGADLRDLAGQVDTLARLFATQPLWQPLAPATDRIARTLIPAAAARLEPALEAALADKATRLGQSDDDLAQVVSAFDQLLVDFDRIATLERDLLELDRLAHRTARLADDVEGLSSLAGDGDVGETKIEVNQRRDEFQRRKQDLVKRHDGLENQLDGLLKRRPEVTEAARQAQLARLRQLGLRARELSAPQRELGTELTAETEAPPAREKKSDAPPPDPATTPLGRQQELARQATAQALEIAAQLGTAADAARDAAAFARAAAGTARQLLAGRIQQASGQATTTAQLAATAATSLEKATEAQPDPVLIRRARDLANRQSTDARMLAATANSAAGRRAIRTVSQQAISAATDLVVRGLEDTAGQLIAPPVELPKKGKQAAQAQATALSGREHMDKVRDGLDASTFKPAATAADDAAGQLEQTARLALAAGNAADRPETPVPERVGEQVTSAVKQLQQSRQSLDQTRFDDPNKQANRPGQKPGSKNGNAKGGKGKSAGGKSNAKGGKSGQKSGGTPKPGQKNGQLSKTASQLRKAARQLARAAKNLQPGQADPNKDAPPPGNKDPNAKDNSGNAGTGSSMSSELKRLEAELARLSGRSWGRLPGTLKTEILQAARRDPNGDYAQLIRFYFEEISRSARQRSDTPTP